MAIGQTLRGIFNAKARQSTTTHANQPRYQELKNAKLDQMRCVLDKLGCIIIDEVGMVSNIIFYQRAHLPNGLGK